MRIHFALSPSRGPVPFSYAQNLASLVNRWLGHSNPQHDSISLYSLGWIQSATSRRHRDGVLFPNGANWFISAPDTPDGQNFLEQIIQSSSKSGEFLFGMEIVETSCQSTPDFGPTRHFRVGSPVFIRGPKTGDQDPHILYDHPEADSYLTQTLRHKLRAAGLENLGETASARFDRSYPSPKTKLIYIKEGKNGHDFQKRAIFCPVIIEGDPEAVKFAWNVGVGGGTGMGFGSLI